MKVLQINAVYKKSSTGRNMSEMHDYMLNNGVQSYIASPYLEGLTENAYQLSSKLDMKIHSLLSRVFGLQGYFSVFSTLGLIKYIKNIKPDIIQLHNLHNNYINLNMLLKHIKKANIALAVTLHDTWFYTGKCCHYLEDNCYKWKTECNNCPALKKHNKSWFFDRTKKMQKDKTKYFSEIKKLGVIGVSKWTCEDAKESTILKKASIHKTIYNWIDTDVFRPYDTEELKRKLSLSDKFVILGVSQQWMEAKGVNIFLELSEMLDDDCIILMIGNQSSYTDNEKIKFIGSTDNVQHLADYYNIADVFLNPSFQETFGKTTAEALSCGTPVIAFNTTASPELVGTDEECGYILDENIAKKYLEKIEIIKKNKKNHYKDNCTRRARLLFDKNANINEYINVYNELLTK